jgi:hypothetical protein
LGKSVEYMIKGGLWSVKLSLFEVQNFFESLFKGDVVVTAKWFFTHKADVTDIERIVDI